MDARLKLSLSVRDRLLTRPARPLPTLEDPRRWKHPERVPHSTKPKPSDLDYTA